MYIGLHVYYMYAYLIFPEDPPPTAPPSPTTALELGRAHRWPSGCHGLVFYQETQGLHEPGKRRGFPMEGINLRI